LRLYILPTFGKRPLASVKSAHVDTWVRALQQPPSSLAPATARSIATTFGGLFKCAIEDEILAVSPVAKAKLPKVEYPPLVPLTVPEVHRLAECAPAFLPAAIVLASGTGLRQGEAMAVTEGRIDWMRRELRIDRQLGSLRRRRRCSLHRSRNGLPHYRIAVRRSRDAVRAHRNARTRQRRAAIPHRRKAGGALCVVEAPSRHLHASEGQCDVARPTPPPRLSVAVSGVSPRVGGRTPRARHRHTAVHVRARHPVGRGPSTDIIDTSLGAAEDWLRTGTQ
jgi:integrase